MVAIDAAGNLSMLSTSTAQQRAVPRRLSFAAHSTRRYSITGEEGGSEKRGDAAKKESEHDPKIEREGLDKSEPVGLLSRKLDEKPANGFE